VNIKDLKEEAELKISFPDESEIEDDVQRIMYTTNSLVDYLLDMGLEPREIYRCMLWMTFGLYFDDQLDLEFARQEAQDYLNESINNSFNRRKELQESVAGQGDFFSIFLDPKSPPQWQ